MGITFEEVEAASVDTTQYTCFRNAAQNDGGNCTRVRAIIVPEGSPLPSGDWKATRAIDAIEGLDRLWIQGGIIFYGIR